MYVWGGESGAGGACVRAALNKSRLNEPLPSAVVMVSLDVKHRVYL